MSEKHTQPEALWLADEFRPTMPREIMVLWGKDAVKELRRLHEANQELLEALKAVRAWDVSNFALDVPMEVHQQMQAAIAKAEGQQ